MTHALLRHLLFYHLLFCLKAAMYAGGAKTFTYYTQVSIQVEVSVASWKLEAVCWWPAGNDIEMCALKASRSLFLSLISLVFMNRHVRNFCSAVMINSTVLSPQIKAQVSVSPSVMTILANYEKVFFSRMLSLHMHVIARRAHIWWPGFPLHDVIKRVCWITDV
jgi:hypothetical protein